MDPYSLKRDNRKKFFDKEKLKRKHATPSDRKYRTLNKAEQPSEEEEQPPLQPNDYRYHEDITMAHGNDDFSSQEVNNKLKEVLQNRNTYEQPSIERITRKNLESMDVEKLNGILGRKVLQAKPLSQPTTQSLEYTDEAKPLDTNKKQSTQSAVPEDLECDQDFLDGII